MDDGFFATPTAALGGQSELDWGDVFGPESAAGSSHSLLSWGSQQTRTADYDVDAMLPLDAKPASWMDAMKPAAAAAFSTDDVRTFSERFIPDSPSVELDWKLLEEAKHVYSSPSVPRELYLGLPDPVLVRAMRQQNEQAQQQTQGAFSMLPLAEFMPTLLSPLNASLSGVQLELREEEAEPLVSDALPQPPSHLVKEEQQQQPQQQQQQKKATSSPSSSTGASNGNKSASATKRRRSTVTQGELVERRRRHNEVEIRRRERIRDNLGELISLTGYTARATDQEAVVNHAIGRIRTLHEKMMQLEERRAQLYSQSSPAMVPSPLPGPVVPPSSVVDHRHAFMSMSAPMFVSVHGVFIDVNQEMLNMLGYSLEEMRGKSCCSFSHPDDTSTACATVQRLFTGEVQYVVVNKRTRHKQGHYVLTSNTVWLAAPAAGQSQPRLVGLIANLGVLESAPAPVIKDSAVAITVEE